MLALELALVQVLAPVQGRVPPLAQRVRVLLPGPVLVQVLAPVQGRVSPLA